MTPWGPILLVAALASGALVAIWRATGNPRYGMSAAALVMALAAGAFGAIATVSFIAALTFLLISGALFMSAQAGDGE